MLRVYCCLLRLGCVLVCCYCCYCCLLVACCLLLLVCDSSRWAVSLGFSRGITDCPFGRPSRPPLSTCLDALSSPTWIFLSSLLPQRAPIFNNGVDRVAVPLSYVVSCTHSGPHSTAQCLETPLLSCASAWRATRAAKMGAPASASTFHSLQ